VNTYRRERDCGSQLHVRAGTKPVTAGRFVRRGRVGFFEGAGAFFGAAFDFGGAFRLGGGLLDGGALFRGFFETVVTGASDGTVVR
jgi:hypothetical protein